MPELSFLQDHFSVPAANLVEPAPSAHQLEQILQSAMSAPDHGQLHPYRFLVIEGEARQQLANVFEQAIKQREPDADEATVKKQKNKPLRSPMIIVVIARIENSPKIPEVEQILCAGAAAQHIQLACRSIGFGSVWLTGANCYDLTVHEALGLEIHERIIGFIYVGTPDGHHSSPQRQNSSSITQHWVTPQHTDFAI